MKNKILWYLKKNKKFELKLSQFQMKFDLYIQALAVFGQTE